MVFKKICEVRWYIVSIVLFFFVFFLGGGTPPLRAVGPWLNHAFFMNLYVVTYLNFHQNVL